MWKYFFSTFVIFALCCAPVFGQQRGQRRGNPGVSPQTIMDTAEVRVTRVQLEAGAVRPSHVHNEGPFHMFIPITSPVEIFSDPREKKREKPSHPDRYIFLNRTRRMDSKLRVRLRSRSSKFSSRIPVAQLTSVLE